MEGKGIERPSAIAARTGVIKAALIRLATDDFLSHVETTKSITINVCDELCETPPPYGSKKEITHESPSHHY